MTEHRLSDLPYEASLAANTISYALQEGQHPELTDEALYAVSMRLYEQQQLKDPTTPGTEMSFSEALEALKEGKRLARDGWVNIASGAFVFYQKGYPEGIGLNANTAEALGLPEGTKGVFLPYLMARLGDEVMMPWTPSARDLLSDDWMIVG